MALIETAIWHTLAYMDVFDYPLTAVEIHRYLEGVPATLSEVQDVLGDRRHPSHLFPQTNGYFHLPGRAHVVNTRRQRAALARGLWPQAVRYGRIMAHFPFVRMVAVTGSLAMDNTLSEADIDFLIVTGNGRVWLCRALILSVVRLAARKHINLCPNYLVAERALRFPVENLYTAHEVTQMVPLVGLRTYFQTRQANNWTDQYLPNASGPPPHQPENPKAGGHWQWLSEIPLRTPLGSWLDRWEMQRKIRKLQASRDTAVAEASFSLDWCKGHFHSHSQHTLQSYQKRLHHMQLLP